MNDTLIRCVDCRCEYRPGRTRSIVCPECGGAAWVAAEIMLSPEPADQHSKSGS